MNKHSQLDLTIKFLYNLRHILALGDKLVELPTTASIALPSMYLSTHLLDIKISFFEND